jgi:hypothetical protein
MQTSHALYIAIFQYSIDHNSFPTGKNSTEAFQKLLDGGYVSDPSFFCLPLRGKVPAEKGAKLKPENVTWDLTADLAANPATSDNVPLVFSTGYRIEYKPGGGAIPLGPLPVYVSRERTWIEWLENRPGENALSPGFAAAYTSGASMFVKALDPTTGIVPNVISADANLGDRTYRQLTPDGELPP